ncbi:MAG: UDP-N-acetylglucosamine 2-epimerase (hydrolyzing) [bacterium]|nr:UDP-N-acetylglucosamine 2-epimerase (hydrolyzing) [bacterium]
MKKRKVGFVTVARSDYNTTKPIVEKALNHDSIEPVFYVTGMHLSPEFGLTVNELKKDGMPIEATVEMLLSSDSPAGITKSMGLGTIGFAQAYENHKPDILVVAGDRFEMHCAAVAAFPFGIPIVHLRGGEVTFGAIDESFRHSITKMSHLHYPGTELSAKRLRQMGEEPWRIKVFGDPSLEDIHRVEMYTRKELEQIFHLDMSKPVILVTFHPVTHEYEHTETYICDLIKTLWIFNRTYNVVFTYPNADTNGRVIIKHIENYCKKQEGAFMVPNFGRKGYYSMMNEAAVMVGNSSSGIWESASFKIPVVNIGRRQEGRQRPANVIDTAENEKAIKRGIEKALSETFVETLKDLKNPYFMENSSDIVIEGLAGIKIDEKLLVKKFCDIPG